MVKGVMFKLDVSDVREPIQDKKYEPIRIGHKKVDSLKANVHFYILLNNIVKDTREIIAVLHRENKKPVVFVIGDPITKKISGSKIESIEPDKFLSNIIGNLLKSNKKALDVDENNMNDINVLLLEDEKIDPALVYEALREYNNKMGTPEALKEYSTKISNLLSNPFENILKNTKLVKYFQSYIDTNHSYKGSINNIEEDFEEWLASHHPEVIYTSSMETAVKEIASVMRNTRNAVITRKNVSDNTLAVSLYGPPGTGKTLVANLIKEYLSFKSKESKNLIFYTPDVKVNLSDAESIKHDLIGNVTFTAKKGVEMNFGALVTALFGIVDEAKKRNLKFAIAHVVTVVQEANLSSGFEQLIEIMRTLGDDAKLKIPIHANIEDVKRIFTDKGIRVISETGSENENSIVIDLTDVCGANDFKGDPENRPPLIGVAYNFLFTENLGSAIYGVKDKGPADIRRIKVVQFDDFEPGDPNVDAIAHSIVNSDSFYLEFMRYINALSENDEIGIMSGKMSVKDVFHRKVVNVITNSEGFYSDTKKFSEQFKEMQNAVTESIKSVYGIFYNLKNNEQAGLVFIPPLIEIYSKFIEPIMYSVVGSKNFNGDKREEEIKKKLSFVVDSYFNTLKGNNLVDDMTDFQQIEDNIVTALLKPIESISTTIDTVKGTISLYNGLEQQEV